jgi:hypothetical protein
VLNAFSSAILEKSNDISYNLDRVFANLFLTSCLAKGIMKAEYIAVSLQNFASSMTYLVTNDMGTQKSFYSVWQSYTRLVD